MKKKKLTHMEAKRMISTVGKGYENGICTLEYAKLLKSMGFRMWVEHYYQDKDLPYSPRGLKKTKDGKKMNHNSYDDFVYSAPTKEYVQYWLYKHFKIKVWVFKNI